MVMVSGIILSQYSLSDRMSEAFAMVSLVDMVDQGWANQVEVARAFGCTTRTVRRQYRRFETGGLAALGRGAGFPRGISRLDHSRRQTVERLKAQGVGQREIARRLGVSEKSVRKMLRRLGWKPTPPTQAELPLEAGAAADPNMSAFASTATGSALPASAPGADPNVSAFGPASNASSLPSHDTDPMDRGADRLLARLGLLEDAAPLFGSALALPRAGVLLSLPALVATGVFACAQTTYGSLGPAFYGLRTSLLTLLLMALWRIKRPEGLKEHSPRDLGRVLGLDRAPEVKTLRRKLSQLAAVKRAVQFGQALAKERVAQRGAALGFLYVDGHVRVYHGQHTLPKAHVARLRISMPATSDYWVNDVAGDPLFVVTAEANAGLVKMLPPILAQVRDLLGKRPLTVVFDRGGYRPALFQQMLAAGFGLLTYRKGRYRRIPRQRFKKCSFQHDGQTVAYVLADQEVRLLKGRLRLRQVTRLMENGHQTPILTSRRDLPAAQVAHRMFNRWRQENFFKYLREEYALDALVEYGAVPDDPTREVPNPVWSALDTRLRQTRACVDRLQSEYGLEAITNLEQQRRTMRGFKTAHGKLAPERKHLSNLVKMVAYQAESDLFRLVAPHYRRADDEGRTLIQSALASAADLEATQSELRITLAPQSSPHRTRAIAALCDQLNQMKTIFPGSQLQLHYAVKMSD